MNRYYLNEFMKPNEYLPLTDKEKEILDKNGINSDYIRKCKGELISLYGISYQIDNDCKLYRII